MSDPADEAPGQPRMGLVRLSLLFAGFSILVCLAGGLVVGMLALLVDAGG